MSTSKAPSVDWLRDRIHFDLLPGCPGRAAAGYRLMQASLDQHPHRHLKTLTVLYTMALAIWVERMNDLQLSDMLPDDDGKALWTYIAWHADSALASLRRERVHRRKRVALRRAGRR